MGVRDIVRPTVDIEVVAGQTVSFRGLTVPEISALVSQNKAVMSAAFDRFTSEDPALSDPMGILQDLAQSAPEVLALVIAVAADDTEAAEHIQNNWTPTMQLKALSGVAAATFEVSSEAGNLLTVVTALMERLTPMLGVVSEKLAVMEREKAKG